jgi:hypothetical protein
VIIFEPWEADVTQRELDAQMICRKREASTCVVISILEIFFLGHAVKQ